MRTLTISLAVLLLAACAQSEKTVTYKDSEGSTKSLAVSDKDGKRTVKSADGLITAEGTQDGKNAQFPPDAPQYAGSRVVSTVNMNMGGMKRQMIVQQTGDAEDKVLAFYKDGFQKAGKRVSEHRSATGVMLTEGPLTKPGVQVIVKGTATGTTINHSVPVK